MDENVADLCIPVWRVIVEVPVKDCAEPAILLREIRIDDQKKNTSVEKEHQKQAVRDLLHDLGVRVVPYPGHQVNRDLLKQQIDDNNDACYAIRKEQCRHDLLVVFEAH